MSLRKDFLVQRLVQRENLGLGLREVLSPGLDPGQRRRRERKLLQGTTSSLNYVAYRDDRGDGADNNGDPAGKGTPGAAPAPTHKLGPKANQGAINAGLRALDRSGKPCKRWQKSGFSLKTFTGVTWQITTWRAPKTKKVELEPGVEQASLPASNSQSKENNNSSNVDSEKSGSGEADLPIMASSPIPAIAVPA